MTTTLKCTGAAAVTAARWNGIGNVVFLICFTVGFVATLRACGEPQVCDCLQEAP